MSVCRVRIVAPVVALVTAIGSCAGKQQTHVAAACYTTPWSREIDSGTPAAAARCAPGLEQRCREGHEESCVQLLVASNEAYYTYPYNDIDLRRLDAAKELTSKLMGGRWSVACGNGDGRACALLAMTGNGASELIPGRDAAISRFAARSKAPWAIHVVNDQDEESARADAPLHCEQGDADSCVRANRTEEAYHLFLVGCARGNADDCAETLALVKNHLVSGPAENAALLITVPAVLESTLDLLLPMCTTESPPACEALAIIARQLRAAGRGKEAARLDVRPAPQVAATPEGAARRAPTAELVELERVRVADQSRCHFPISFDTFMIWDVEWSMAANRVKAEMAGKDLPTANAAWPGVVGAFEAAGTLPANVVWARAAQDMAKYAEWRGQFPTAMCADFSMSFHDHVNCNTSNTWESCFNVLLLNTKKALEMEGAAVNCYRTCLAVAKDREIREKNGE